ncbi:glutathione S-transferase [Gluconacetobacter tumulicola]|uniref:Glutathione S-transferase family protein n=2 Tax=Gluconacetobacter tumulicola TaxID=1017177 RepID=A0A7W4JB59_9PROT|nr:glutathione S-transferase family protein [Gluconacetobacter tumulicola]
MKLYHAPLSPYARKVRAAVILLGLEARVTEIAVRVSDSPPEVLAANPLCKIPALELPDGEGVYDSRVIVDYLDGLAGGGRLVPAGGEARRRVLRMQALGDGLADAAILVRTLIPAGLAHDHPLVQRQLAAVRRSLDRLESEPPALEPIDIGGLSVACALGYLDVRFADDPWRLDRPALAAWYEAACRLPCLARTAVTL